MATRKEFNDTLKKHIEALKENTNSSKYLASSLHLFGERLRTLASETGAWRKDDAKHHRIEDEKNEDKIKAITLTSEKLGELIKVLKEKK